MVIRPNPIIRQTVHDSGWPSLRNTLALLGGLLIVSLSARNVQLRTWNSPYWQGLIWILLLAVWLMPLVTMYLSATSTARRMRKRPTQMLSTMSDSQVVLGFGLSTLYRMRLALTIAFGILPVLVVDTFWDSLALALFLVGLHLLGALLGTVLILRWGRERLNVVLAVLGCTLVLILNRLMWSLFSLDILGPGCRSLEHPVFSPHQYMLPSILMKRGLRGLISMLVTVVLPFQISGAVGRIGWRETKQKNFPLEISVGLLAFLLLFGMDTIRVENSERRALVALYEATNGEEWNRSDNWLSARPICDWYGVGCCGLKVGSIELEDNGLKGKIPPEFGQLPNLIQLNLSNNQLTELPPEFGQLTNLIYLSLNDNQLTELPSEFGQLPKLYELNLSNNQLTELPPEFSQLINLSDLYLNGNQLTELPPELGQIPDLHRLNLSDNHLVELPSEVCQHSPLFVEPSWLCPDKDQISDGEQTQPPAQTTPAQTTPAPTVLPAPSSTSVTTPLQVLPVISYFRSSSPAIRAGDTVSFSWAATGERAQLCQSRVVNWSGSFYTYEDCWDVPLAGPYDYVIPDWLSDEDEYLQFELKVESGSPPETVSAVITRPVVCSRTWFFSENQVLSYCPKEPVEGLGIYQYFEHGMMIWHESVGRYLVFTQLPENSGDCQLFQFSPSDVDTDIIQDDTPAIYLPPRGLFVPKAEFGLIWRGNVSNMTFDQIEYFREVLGWALAPETDFDTIWQCNSTKGGGNSSINVVCYLQGPEGRVFALSPYHYNHCEAIVP